MYGFGGSGGSLTASGASAQNGDGTITNPRANSGGGGRRVSGTTPGNAGNGNGAAGSIGGPVSVAGGGTLSPGNSIASLATGTATFASDATFEYEIDSTNPASLGAAADLLVVNGDLDLDPGNGTILTVTDLATAPNAFLPNTSFALINYSGSWNGGLFTYSGTVLADGSRVTVGAHEWEIDYDLVSAAGLANFTADYLPSGRFVAFRAIPEPTTCFIALTGLACGGFSMWRRRKPGRPRRIVQSRTGASRVRRLSQPWDPPQRRPEPTRRNA